MTTKPRLFKPIPGSTYRGVVAALPDDIKVAARSLPDFKPWVVAALIAEGGETIWWCKVAPVNAVCGPSTDWFSPVISEWHKDCAWRLVFPIPVESAEAKETPDSRDTGEKP